MTTPDVPADVMAAIEAHANACVDHDLAAMLATRSELRCAIAKALEAARRDKSWPQWMKDAAAPDPYGNKP